MRYWMDTEFIDDGKSIDLISIGIVSDDGRVFYGETDEFDREKANPWVRKNVFPHLGKGVISSREGIRWTITRFMDVEKYGKPEMWGWCAGYDFVAFCQLFGTMMDLPKGYPHYIKDFQYVLDVHEISDEHLPPQESSAHNALEDAKYLQKLWGYIVRCDAWQ